MSIRIVRRHTLYESSTYPLCVRVLRRYHTPSQSQRIAAMYQKEYLTHHVGAPWIRMLFQTGVSGSADTKFKPGNIGKWEPGVSGNIGKWDPGSSGNMFNGEPGQRQTEWTLGVSGSTRGA